MSTLIAIIYRSQKEARDAWMSLSNRERKYQVEMEDAVVAYCQNGGSVKLRQMVSLAKSGAIRGVWWGALIGLLVAGPVGLVVAGAGGAAFGAISGSFAEHGIDADFIDQLKQHLQPGNAALFLMLKDESVEELMVDLKDVGGLILETSLSEDQEKKLQEAMAKNDVT